MAANPFIDEDVTETSASPSTGPGKRQIGLGKLQWLVAVLCLACAGLGALLRMRVEDERFLPASLALIILPSGMLILVGMFRGGIELYRNWRADRELWKPLEDRRSHAPRKPDERKVD